MFQKRLGSLVLGVILIALPVLSFAADSQPAKPRVHPEMVVSAEWLAQHLKDPKVVVLHVADQRSEYDAGHIPGARFVATEDIAEGNVVELPPANRLKEVFEKAGVSDDTRIVIYTTSWYPVAGRAFYTLDYMGHGNHAALLDGGFEEWRAEKRPVSTEAVTPAKGNLTLHVHPEVRALLDEVKKVSGQDSKSVLLVDSRPGYRYTAGHIAGSVPLYWQDTLVDPKNKPTFLPPEKLQEVFAARGIHPGQKLVTYCEVGLQASHMYFVARYLGYDAAMYDGSFHDWVHVNNLPLVKGTSLR
ncbi:MAG: sulfurtransferase [Acidobacteriia bacterium]|nr:sulfurtransferase [Terriglobia bacterium]